MNKKGLGILVIIIIAAVVLIGGGIAVKKVIGNSDNSAGSDDAETDTKCLEIIERTDLRPLVKAALLRDMNCTNSGGSYGSSGDESDSSGSSDTGIGTGSSADTSDTGTTGNNGGTTTGLKKICLISKSAHCSDAQLKNFGKLENCFVNSQITEETLFDACLTESTMDCFLTTVVQHGDPQANGDYLAESSYTLGISNAQEEFEKCWKTLPYPCSSTTIEEDCYHSTSSLAGECACHAECSSKQKVCFNNLAAKAGIEIDYID